MSSCKRTELLEKIKEGFAKPKDLQNESLLLGEETIPKLFTPLAGREKSCYEEEKLHYESAFIRKPVEERNSYDKLNSRKTNTKPITKNRFVEKKYESIGSWLVWTQGSNNITGPFSSKEMAEKMNKGELINCNIKRMNDTLSFSYDELRKETKLPFVDDQEMINFLSKKEKINEL